MNKPVQILLLIALLPMIGTAREETLEERKQRIARKYLRERMAITQSDMFVPSDLPEEDEDVIDSERFKDAEVDIAKHEGGVTPVRPPPRPRPVPQADSNWLLGDMDESEDPSADPYSTLSIDSGDDLGATWGDKTEGKTSGDDSRKRQSYDPRNDPYAQKDSRTGIMGGKDRQQGTQFGRSSILGRTDGSEQQNPSSYSSALNLQGSRRTRTYGSNPTEGLLSTPYTQQAEGATGTDRKSSGGYQPYKSPYEEQREQRQQQWKSQPQQEFKRPDSYQQWKERNKTWDPTADDAYINEMMQQNKR